MDPLNIKLDFTGHSPAGPGITILLAGLHEATLSEFKVYETNGKARLYAYMVTDGKRHRETFNLQGNGLSFLMTFLISAGVSEKKLSGPVQIPFHKLAGKTVYFRYEPPEKVENGKAATGSYPSYTFYTKEQFKALAKAAPVVADDEADLDEPEPEDNGVADEPAPTAEASTDDEIDGDDDLSWLDEDV